MKSTSITLDISLHFSRPPTYVTAKVPRFPLHCVVNNPTTRATLNYSIVDEFEESPSIMSTLEVLRTFPSQHQALLSSLGFIDPYDSRLITFNLDQGEPQMPLFVSF